MANYDKDPLGTRMKDHEMRTRTYLGKKSYKLIRLDGKAFHTFTKGFKRPYDLTLMGWMDATAIALCDQIEGARFAFVQSDEIQILVTDFSNQHTELWFDGGVQKIVSVSASIAAAAFHHTRAQDFWDTAKSEIYNTGFEHAKTWGRPDTTARRSSDQIMKEFAALPQALFDSRVWQITPKIEVYNAFLWRQNDCTRNAISMTTQAHFSHKELQGKSSNEMQEMLFQHHGINFNDLPVGFKRGRFIEKVTYTTDVMYEDRRTGDKKVAKDVTRSKWVVVEPPIFSTPEGRQWLLDRIPDPGEMDREKQV